MAVKTGLRFQCNMAGDSRTGGGPRTLLIEVALAGPVSLGSSRTGGINIWCLAATCSAGRSAALFVPLPQLTPHQTQACGIWDAHGHSLATNVFVRLVSSRAASAGSSSSDDGYSCSSGSDGELAPPQCQLGVLVQHALPKLAAHVGGYFMLGLDWVTWSTWMDGADTPCIHTLTPFGSQDEAHWQRLRELAQEESNVGPLSMRPLTPRSSAYAQPCLEPVEELLLRAAKDKLVDMARFFSDEAVARVSRLIIRKCCSGEYRFFEGDTDVACSRREALEWAVGAEAVRRMLDRSWDFFRVW